MKQLSAFLVVLLTGIVLMPQHAWSQPGAIVNGGLQLQGTPLNILFYDGTYTGTLLPASLSGNRTWTLPDASGMMITTGNASDLNGLVAVNVNAPLSGNGTSVNPLGITVDDSTIQVSGGQLTVGTIPVSKLAVTANNLIVGNVTGQGSLLAPGSDGQVLTIVSGTPTWQTLSGTVPNGTAADQLLRWNSSTNAWEAVSLTQGTGISITHGASDITVTNTGDTDPSNDLTTTTTFSAAATSDATVSGTYNSLDIQLNAGVVGSTEIADGTITNDDISSTAGIAVSKLAPGSNGQVLTIVSGTPTWQTLSGTVPNGTAADQLLRWNNSTNAWEAVSLTQGTGISITHGASDITVTNTGDTDPSNDLTTTTTFSAAATSDATVSGTYNSLDIQLNAGVVGSTEIADGTITNDDISSTAGIAVSKLAPGSNGQVLTIVSGTPTWQTLSGTVPNGTAADQLLRWNNSTNAWEAVSLTQGTGISITHGASDITVTNTGDTDPSNDLTTTTTFSAAATSDATVSGTYNSLDIQLNAGVVGSTEIADGTITNDDISSTAGIAVSKLAPGSNGQVLTIVSGTPTWQTLSGTVPNGTAADQLLRWNSSTNAWEAVSLTQGTGISITHGASDITVTNTGDTDPSNDLTTTTTFSAAATSDATVSGTYNSLDIQLNAGVVGSTEIADGTITNDDISSTAGIAVSKLAPGSNGQVLTVVSGTPTWQTLSGTVPNGTAADQLLRWNNSTNAWEAVSLTQGTGISITHGASDITVTNTGDTDPSNDLTTTTTFSAAATSDATVSGTYNSLDIQLNAGVVGSTEIADGTITNDDISSTAGIAVSKLAPGSNGQVLTVVSGTPTWTSLSAAGGWAVGGNNLGGGGTGVLGTTSNDNLEVQTNGTLAMYINASNQHVGIGTNAPQSRLHVHGSAVRVTNSTTGSTATDGFVVGLSSSDAELRQNENARILFNTNAAAGSDTVEAQLTSTGQLAFFTTGTPGFRVDLPNNSANAVGRIRAVGLSYWSSQQWKQDIRPIPNALEKTLALRGVNYRWKPEYGGSDDIGFIMEEVASVVPEVVQRDERTGELQGMDYARLTALLVEALKEEHRRNEELRAELAQLRKLVERVAMQQGITSGGSSINVRVDGDWLGQNVPNPHDGTTTIPCYVPAGVSNAQLVVADVAGQLIRSVTISARNTWTNVALDMTLLASGTYEYRLVFDGRTVATKQMQLVR